MNAGQVPGAVVSDELLNKVIREWQDKRQGRALAVERAARLGAVLKGWATVASTSPASTAVLNSSAGSWTEWRRSRINGGIS